MTPDTDNKIKLLTVVVGNQNQDINGIFFSFDKLRNRCSLEYYYKTHYVEVTVV